MKKAQPNALEIVKSLGAVLAVLVAGAVLGLYPKCSDIQTRTAAAEAHGRIEKRVDTIEERQVKQQTQIIDLLEGINERLSE